MNAKAYLFHYDKFLQMNSYSLSSFLPFPCFKREVHNNIGKQDRIPLPNIYIKGASKKKQIADRTELKRTEKYNANLKYKQEIPTP